MKKTLTLLAFALIAFTAFSQTQRLVLFEEFTGENCPPCAGVNPYLDQLASDYPNEVVLMHYLAPIPTGGILSAEVQGVVAGRLIYYGVNSTPWGQQDGVIWDSTLLTSSQDPYQPFTWAATNSGAENPTYLNNEYTVPSPFTISVTDTLTDYTDSFYVTVTITAAEDFNASGSKLQMAMVEDLQFANPPGNNGETTWGASVRAMYPTYNGTTLTPSNWTNGQTNTYQYKGKIPGFVRDKTKVRFVAFVQNTATKNIAQTGISNYYTLDADIATTGVQANFLNCYSSKFTPKINLSNAGNQAITSAYIYEFIDGVLLDSILWSGNLSSGSFLTYDLPALNLSTGVHVLKFALASPNYFADNNPGNDTATITLDVPVQPVDPPLVEDFEGGDPATNGDGWAVANPDHDSTWRLVDVGDGSSYSYSVPLGFDNFGGDEFVSPVNYLYAPPLNLTYAAHATVVFNFANQWVNFGTGYYPGQDTLFIDVSNDCGNSWTNVYSTTAATAPSQNYGSSLGEFIPTADEWGTDSANISAVANNPDVLLRFRVTSSDGNDFYLDNINIYKYDSVPYTAPAPTAINQLSNLQSVSVYPNPANDVVNLNVELSQSLEVGYQVIDLTGNLVVSGPTQAKSVGQNIISINTSSLAEGAYFVTVIAGTEKVSKMIAVTH